jgi:hypothetical protein
MVLSSIEAVVYIGGCVVIILGVTLGLIKGLLRRLLANLGYMVDS